jgi:hypothetical protein
VFTGACRAGENFSQKSHFGTVTASSATFFIAIKEGVQPYAAAGGAL